MSLVATQSVTSTVFFQRLNEGAWTVLADLYTGSSGTYYQVSDRDGRKLVVLVTDLTGKTGIKILLNRDETETTGTITNATAKTYALAANTYSFIEVESWVGYDNVAAAVNIGFALKIDGVNTDHTATLQTASTSGFVLNSPLAGSKKVQAASTVTIGVTVTTGTATWRIYRMIVWGVT